MKLHNFFFAALAMFAFVGCEEPENPGGDGGGTNTGNAEVFTIAVDKATIEADGIDAATFIVTNADGVNVKDMPGYAEYVYFVNEADDSRLPRGSQSFSSFRNGTFTFHATVKGKPTTNSVQITAQNRSAYEKYQQKVCVFQCTGTQCGYCPFMTEAIAGLRAGENKDNVIVLAAHGNIPSTDPYTISVGGIKDLGTYICQKYNGGGFPYAVYDFAFGAGDRSVSYLNSAIENILMSEPAACGIKISKAQIDAEGNGVIEASVKASKAGTFDLAWAVLVDNLPQNGGVEPIYNDVIIAVSDNFLAMSNDTKAELAADEELSKTFEFKVTPFRGIEFKPADCKVVVFAHNGRMIDNANICAVGSSVPYLYNE